MKINSSEKSFFFRHCLTLPIEWKHMSNYLIKEFKANDFEVYSFEDSAKKKLHILLSQQKEEKILRQAQYLKIKKDFRLFEESKDLCLPRKVLQFEKEKNYIYSQRQDFLPNQSYYLLNDNKKTDERWGLGLFTEGEMLFIEKSIIEEVAITDKEKLITLIKQLDSETTKELTYHFENGAYLVPLLIKANIVASISPLHISSFPERIIKSTSFSLKCPYHTIRSYFNDTVGIYFAWLFHYTIFLFIPAITSFLLFILAKIFPEHKKKCLVFFSIFMPIWAQFFIISWNQKTSELSVEWDNHSDIYDKENQRKEFKGVLRRSPISNEMILHYSSMERQKKYALSFVKSLSILILALFTNIVFLNLLGFIRPSHKSVFFINLFNQLSEEGRLFAINSTSNTILGYVHLGIIFGLNLLYRYIAESTTNEENHQVRSNHNNTLIIKRFVFEFLDSFFCLFYLAFIAKDLVALRSMLVTIFFGNEIRRLALETLMPNALKLLSNFNQYLSFLKGGDKDRGIAVGDYKVNEYDIIKQIESEEYDTFDDYLEPVLEFAYLTIFAECIPFASIFIILANSIEIRSDIIKLGTVFKRPEHVRKRNIGSWHIIIQMIAFLSVFTNLLFAFMFTSNSFEMNFDNLLYFGLSEHLSLFVILALRLIIPSQKEWVRLFFARKEYNLKENKWKTVLKRLTGNQRLK